MHTNSPWACVIRVCSNGVATYIIGEISSNSSISHSELKHIILLYTTASCMASFGYLTWNKRELDNKYIIFGIHYCIRHKLQVFITFSYLGDHVLSTKLSSERCANDFNHFTFSIAKIDESSVF